MKTTMKLKPNDDDEDGRTLLLLVVMSIVVKATLDVVDALVLNILLGVAGAEGRTPGWLLDSMKPSQHKGV